MDTFQGVINGLASPPWFFALALLLFLLSRGAKLPWTIGGGVGLAILAAAFVGVSLSDPGFRHLILHPERLPVVVLLLSTGTLLWHEMYRARRADAATTAPEEAPPAGFSAADVLAATAVGLLVILCAALVPSPLAGLADPASQPAMIKAPWFLAGLQELRHDFDPWWALIVLPWLYLAGLLGLPYLETDDDKADPRLRGLFLFGWLCLWLWPLAVAVLLRGPHWNAYGPFETWDAARPAMPTALTLSQRFWIQWLGIPEPARWWLRELPGLLSVVGYFTLVPRQLLRWRATRELSAVYREALGGWRFHAALFWILAVLIVPLQWISRWWLGIGDWIHIPELGFFHL